MVGTGIVADQLDTVVGGVGLEVSRGRPVVGASVLDVVYDGSDGDDVGGRTAEKHEGDRVCGRWRPGDGVGLAGGNDFVQAWAGDWVARWIANLRLMLGENSFIVGKWKFILEVDRHWRRPHWRRRRREVEQTLWLSVYSKSRLPK